MTTARRNLVQEDGTTPADPFDRGSGYVRPNAADDPGLVYDVGFDEYQAFLCGNGQRSATECANLNIEPVPPADLNQPNIALGALTGVRTVTRTVTNVGAADATYTARVEGLEGIDVEVEPALLSVPAGGSATYTVTFTVAAATPGEYAFGQLTLSDGAHRVRSALAILPDAIDAPEVVSGVGVAGTATWDVTLGYAGPLTAAPRGLVPPTTFEGEVATDEAFDVIAAAASGVGASVHRVPVPAGSGHARFSLAEDATTVPGEDDLDLYVFRSDDDELTEDELVETSDAFGSDEQVDLVLPGAGTYHIVVHGFATVGPTATYELSTWVVGGADAGNLEVTAPAMAVPGATEEVTATWSGLEPGTAYLGAVTYHDTPSAPAVFTDALRGQTLVEVQTPDLG
ncbi:MAG: hypothetical protein M3R01_10930 [Actinomycetota bacterium]|nr:hypothetical protein [Actinomycetota bacterium]